MLTEIWISKFTRTLPFGIWFFVFVCLFFFPLHLFLPVMLVFSHSVMHKQELNFSQVCFVKTVWWKIWKHLVPCQADLSPKASTVFMSVVYQCDLFFNLTGSHYCCVQYCLYCLHFFFFLEEMFLLKPLKELRAKRKGTQMFCSVDCLCAWERDMFVLFKVLNLVATI